MTHFLLLIAVSAGLAMFRGCPMEPLPDAAARAVLTLVGMAMIPVAAQLGTAYAVDMLSADRRGIGHVCVWFDRLRRVHAGLWLAVVAVSDFVLRWPQLVRANWHGDALPLGGDLAALVPAVVPLVASWTAFHRWEAALAATRHPAPATTASAAGSPMAHAVAGVPSRRHYVMLHVRFFVGIAVLPAILLLAILDAARWAAPDGFSAAPGLAMGLAGVGLVVVVFPWLLRRVWKSRPLDDATTAGFLSRLAREAGVSVRHVRRWETGGLVANAATSGLLARFRTVWLSDGLLDGLGIETVGAIFAHELGHLRHRHLVVRLAVLLAPLAALGVFRATAFQTAALETKPFLGGGDISCLVFAAAATAACAVYMGLVFGWVCRRLELEADLFAAQTLGQAMPERGWHMVIEALEALAAAQGPADRRRGGWLHPSVARRVEFLKRCGEDSEYLLHFQRRVGRLRRLWVWGTAALALAGLLAAA